MNAASRSLNECLCFCPLRVLLVGVLELLVKHKTQRVEYKVRLKFRDVDVCNKDDAFNGRGMYVSRDFDFWSQLQESWSIFIALSLERSFILCFDLIQRYASFAEYLVDQHAAVVCLFQVVSVLDEAGTYTFVRHQFRSSFTIAVIGKGYLLVALSHRLESFFTS